MNPNVQRYLDERFEKGKQFLESQEDLLKELSETFEAEIWGALENQAIFRLGQKMALPLQPSLQSVVNRQILFAWGLGFAVGSAVLRENPAPAQLPLQVRHLYGGQGRRPSPCCRPWCRPFRWPVPRYRR